MGVWGCMYGRTGLQASPTPLVRQSLTAFYILYRTSHPHVLVTFAPKVTRQIPFEPTVGRTLHSLGDLHEIEALSPLSLPLFLTLPRTARESICSLTKRLSAPRAALPGCCVLSIGYRKAPRTRCYFLSVLTSECLSCPARLCCSASCAQALRRAFCGQPPGGRALPLRFWW